MIEIALAIAANVLVAGALAFVAKNQGKRGASPAGEWRADAVGAAARVGVVAVVAWVLGALLRGATPMSKASVVASAWVAGACVVGGAAVIVGERARAWIASRVEADEDALTWLRAQTSMLLLASLVVTLLLTCEVAVASAASDALRRPDVAAPPVALGAIGFALGAAVASPAFASQDQQLTETATLTVAAMVVCATFWQANAALFRRGPVVATALGFLLLPVVLSPLFSLAAAAGALFARASEGETAAHAASRSVHVSASLVVVVLFGTTLGALGDAWVPFFFCGVAGVAAVLAWFHWAARAKGEGGAVVATLVIGGLAAMLSAGVGEKTGLAHAERFGVVLAALSASATAMLPRAMTKGTDSPPKSAVLASSGAQGLAALAVGLAVMDAVDQAACARWASSILAPAEDAAGAWSHCAESTVRALDVSRPAVIVSALLGAAMARFLDPESIRSLVLGAVGLVLTTLVGRLENVAPACLSAAALGALMTSAAIPSPRTRHVALLTASLSAALAPIAL